MTDAPAHSGTHFNKHESFMPPLPLMIDITECCMTFAQSRPSKGREQEEERGREKEG